tara:strand:+ start:535 stop:699 length:165 start_codon:yes stop_codon:yes gene_type:complete
MKQLTYEQAVKILDEKNIAIDDGCFYDTEQKRWLPISLITHGWINIHNIPNYKL